MVQVLFRNPCQAFCHMMHLSINLRFNHFTEPVNLPPVLIQLHRADFDNFKRQALI